jgi:hypothetical protein
MSELPQAPDSGSGAGANPQQSPPAPESSLVPMAEPAPVAAQVYSPPQAQAQPQPRISQTGLGCMIGAGIIAAATLIAGLLVAFALRDSANRVVQTAEQINPANIVATLIPPATPTIVVRPPAVLTVRAISDLATAQSLMSTVVEAEQARVGNVIYEKLVLIACGRVKAGIDLSKLDDSDVTVGDDGKTVRVKLPPAEFLDAYLIDDADQPCTTRVYDRTNLIVIPETKELEAQAREKALDAIVQTASQSGLLSDARRNAEIAIERILLNAGYETVEFVTE